MWIWSKFVNRTANGDLSGAQLVSSMALATRHTLLVCYTIGSTATINTSLLLVAIDFITNIFICGRIVLLKKRRPLDLEKQLALLRMLALNELIEFVVPLAYIMSLAIAYYGPNSHLLGGVGMTIWTYNAIEDLIPTLQIILFFWMGDFCSAVVSGIALKVFCNISLLEACMSLQKEFGIVLSVMISSSILAVCS
jgi:hypothetical protein